MRRLGLRALLTITAVLALLTAMVGAVSADPVFATVDGYAEGSAANNEPGAWGENCDKPNTPEGGWDATFTLPDLAAGLVYDLVVVKAGSDSSTEDGPNTLFDDPAEGETVWADSNSSGTFDDGDKNISHIIICTKVDEGSLTIAKQTNPDGSTVDFSFSGTLDASPITGFTLKDNGSKLFDGDGTYVVNETVPAPTTTTNASGSTTSTWTLDSIDCGAATVTKTATGVTVVIDGNDVTCTFNNRLTTTTTTFSPTLGLDKAVTSGNADTEFAFSWGAQGGTMAPLANPLSANDGVVQLANVAGTYVITEAALGSEWNFSGIDCVGNAAQESVTGQTVTVTVGANEDVVCTFTNAPQSTLSGNPPSPAASTAAQAPVRQGTLASSLPNTAMDGPADQLPVIVLAAAALASLAYVAHRNIEASKSRS